jgi:hypothetical protein
VPSFIVLEERRSFINAHTYTSTGGDVKCILIWHGVVERAVKGFLLSVPAGA